MTQQLQITNFIDVSVSQAQAGISAYNTSNLACFSSETPGVGFGTDGFKIYLEPTEVGEDFGTSSVTYALANASFSQQPNMLAGGGYFVVILLEPSETLDDAIVRTVDTVQYFGLMCTDIQSQVDMLAAAAVVQPLNKVLFCVQRASASIDPGGSLDLLRTGSLTHTRGLYYGSTTDLEALVMQAAYAGRALSVNFSGSNTTFTMHLKDLFGVQPDPTITQTQLNKAKAAGADTYASYQGVPKVFCTGANRFYDSVYNEQWFVGAIQVAGFNFLAQSATKIPQTEGGMLGLKGAYRAVCEQGVSNLYIAPGSWTSSSTIGNQADLLQNIAQRGYYIFSSPIATQLQVDRAARKAPLVQIAIKEAGAIQSSFVVISVNA